MERFPPQKWLILVISRKTVGLNFIYLPVKRSWIGSVVLQVKNIYTLNCKIVLFLKSRKSIKIYFFTSKCQSKETSPLSIALNQDKPEEQYDPRYSPFCIEMAGR